MKLFQKDRKLTDILYCINVLKEIIQNRDDEKRNLTKIELDTILSQTDTIDEMINNDTFWKEITEKSQAVFEHLAKLEAKQGIEHQSKESLLKAMAEINETLFYLWGINSDWIAAMKRIKTINARSAVKKRDRTIPEKEKARELAVSIWERERRKALLDTAYEIQNTLNLRQAATTIQEWIRDLNPNKTKKE
ncbi:hypothetical protein JP35_08490 [Gallibacterium anatis]|uniref:hypothetical protein n=1 Tax=Gallibacterium anatis TaxID=750 RepID=UPI0005311528|nr:hypothetical protein [Gallibacterium anatis]KGQ38162.1 hypothetical protein JP35_08490 [Gallibacterium anatis]